MRTALLLLLALAAPALSGTASAADVWKWVDEKGITHYSDQPVAGATKIEVRTGNVVGTASGTYTGNPSSSSTDSAQRAAPSYRNFEIWRPEQNQAFINTGGAVNVEIRIEPAVRPQDRLDLYLDGKVVTGFSRNTLSYSLTELPRGTHTVNAVVTDQSGQSVAQSAPVTFTVRQESIAQPPTGPSLRPPPPKPQPRASNKVLTTQPSYGALHNTPTAIDPATNLPVVKKPAPKPGKP
ncbi:MAG TPA: DUF4124 domain-containing protein [Steroidobacteraceae bacterium]|nr:DUF4124 domain-containing protein [Steroidobacteraceae bacterium]